MLLLRCLRKQTNKHAEYSDCATFRNIFMTGIKDLKKKKKSIEPVYVSVYVYDISKSQADVYVLFRYISVSLC